MNSEFSYIYAYPCIVGYNTHMDYRIKPQWCIFAAIAGIIGGLIFGNIAIGVAIFVLVLVPVFITIYIPYAKDNPEHYWFKRKLYGWGWTPVTWEGWFVTILYVLLLIAAALTIDDGSPAREVAFTFILPAILLTAAFIRIAYKKGESPRWQWGRDKDE